MKKFKPEWVKESCCPKCGCPIYAKDNGDGNPPEVRRTCFCVTGEAPHYYPVIYPAIQPSPFDYPRPWWSQITSGGISSSAYVMPPDTKVTYTT